MFDCWEKKQIRDDAFCVENNTENNVGCHPLGNIFKQLLLEALPVIVLHYVATTILVCIRIKPHYFVQNLEATLITSLKETWVMNKATKSGVQIS